MCVNRRTTFSPALVGERHTAYRIYIFLGSEISKVALLKCCYKKHVKTLLPQIVVNPGYLNEIQIQLELLFLMEHGLRGHTFIKCSSAGDHLLTSALLVVQGQSL